MKMRRCLDPNGSLIVDLVPELKLIIGPQPVPDLPPQDAQNRFQLVFGRFINVSARPDHPDDLQWLDAATLDKAVEIKVNFYAAHLKGWA